MTTQQSIYDRLRTSTRSEYVLEEMIRLGFWSEGAKTPIPEELKQRRHELNSCLQQLYQRQNAYKNPEKALQLLRKERMRAAKERREQTKQKRALARQTKALAWHTQQQTDIQWLGAAISAGLADKTTETTRLQAKQLPILESAQQLAQAIGISLNELRFLAYQRTTSRVNHYQRFQIAKKAGGVRAIAAPMPRLKRVQYWILDNILNTQTLHDAAHGFVQDRSIISNATPHVGKAVVINLDLQNFFPSISYKRVKGLFKSFGYSEAIATILALLCTESEVDEVELDGKTWFVMRGTRHLPQGAPTSPAISNLLARSLDKRLQGIAYKYGYTYTRYADDLTFSGQTEAKENLTRLMWAIRQTIKDEGFSLHPDKTRIMHQGQQQEVTGLIVNQHLSIERQTLRRFRALLQQIQQSGLADKYWNGIHEPQHLLRAIEGYANFVMMVLPNKGIVFKKQIAQIKQSANLKTTHSRIAKVTKQQFRQAAAQGHAPFANWPEAKAKPAPQLELTQQQQMNAKQAKKQAENKTEQIVAQTQASPAVTELKAAGSKPASPGERYRQWINSLFGRKS